MISIVIPAYNEERNLQALYAALREVLRSAGEDDFELLFVDDGSTDRTWETIKSLSSADVRVRGVRLSRNFGHQSALMAGLAAGRGQLVRLSRVASVERESPGSPGGGRGLATVEAAGIEPAPGGAEPLAESRPYLATARNDSDS